MKSHSVFKGLKPVLRGMLSLDMLMLVNGAMLVLLQQTKQTVQNFAPFFKFRPLQFNIRSKKFQILGGKF